MPLPFRPFLVENHLDSNNHLRHPSHSFHFNRALCGCRSDYPCHGSQISWCAPLLCCTAGNHDGKMDGALLHTRIRNCCPRVVSSISRLSINSYQSGVCHWWCACGLAAHQTCGIFLVVCLPLPPIEISPNKMSPEHA
jgi:hypothetical protein